MQQEKSRRSNVERTEATRAALVEAARRLFVEKGYAETGTPEIVAAAGVTRGALYHHFADKQALFRAVVEQESAAVAQQIDTAAPEALAARDALEKGGEAFLEAMRVAGRTRLLLLDGPAVLGRAEMDAIDATIGGTRSLRAGFAAAMREAGTRGISLEALTTLVSAAYDRAALAVASGADPGELLTAINAMIDGALKAKAPGPRRTGGG